MFLSGTYISKIVFFLKVKCLVKQFNIFIYKDCGNYFGSKHPPDLKPLLSLTYTAFLGCVILVNLLLDNNILLQLASSDTVYITYCTKKKTSCVL